MLIERLSMSSLHWGISPGAARHIGKVTPIDTEEMEVEDTDALG